MSAENNNANTCSYDDIDFNIAKTNVLTEAECGAIVMNSYFAFVQQKGYKYKFESKRNPGTFEYLATPEIMYEFVEAIRSGKCDNNDHLLVVTNSNFNEFRHTIAKFKSTYETQNKKPIVCLSCVFFQHDNAKISSSSSDGCFYVQCRNDFENDTKGDGDKLMLKGIFKVNKRNTLSYVNNGKLIKGKFSISEVIFTEKKTGAELKKIICPKYMGSCELGCNNYHFCSNKIACKIDGCTLIHDTLFCDGKKGHKGEFCVHSHNTRDRSRSRSSSRGRRDEKPKESFKPGRGNKNPSDRKPRDRTPRQ